MYVSQIFCLDKKSPFTIFSLNIFSVSQLRNSKHFPCSFKSYKVLKGNLGQQEMMKGGGGEWAAFTDFFSSPKHKQVIEHADYELKFYELIVQVHVACLSYFLGSCHMKQEPKRLDALTGYV